MPSSTLHAASLSSFAYLSSLPPSLPPSLPVYKDMSEAVKKHPEADVLINFASLRSAYDATLEALNLNQVRHLMWLVWHVLYPLSHVPHLSYVPQFRAIAIIAEGIPENKTKKLIKKAQEKGVAIIGPATVSLVSCPDPIACNFDSPT